MSFLVREILVVFILHIHNSFRIVRVLQPQEVSNLVKSNWEQIVSSRVTVGVLFIVVKVKSAGFRIECMSNASSRTIKFAATAGVNPCNKSAVERSQHIYARQSMLTAFWLALLTWFSVLMYFTYMKKYSTHIKGQIISLCKSLFLFPFLSFFT